MRRSPLSPPPWPPRLPAQVALPVALLFGGVCVCLGMLLAAVTLRSLFAGPPASAVSPSPRPLAAAPVVPPTVAPLTIAPPEPAAPAPQTPGREPGGVGRVSSSVTAAAAPRPRDAARDKAQAKAREKAREREGKRRERAERAREAREKWLEKARERARGREEGDDD